MGANAQVALEKFARYFDVECRLVPISVESQYRLDPKKAMEMVDENTIGVFVILGSASWLATLLVYGQRGIDQALTLVTMNRFRRCLTSLMSMKPEQAIRFQSTVRTLFSFFLVRSACWVCPEFLFQWMVLLALLLLHLPR